MPSLARSPIANASRYRNAGGSWSIHCWHQARYPHLHSRFHFPSHPLPPQDESGEPSTTTPLVPGAAVCLPPPEPPLCLAHTPPPPSPAGWVRKGVNPPRGWSVAKEGIDATCHSARIDLKESPIKGTWQDGKVHPAVIVIPCLHLSLSHVQRTGTEKRLQAALTKGKRK
jgi:hypothetical protein